MNDMSTKSKKKPLLIVLGILLALICVLVGTCVFFSVKNNKLIYEMIGDGLSQVAEHYTVTECDAAAQPDKYTDEYQDMRIYGFMKFHTYQYEIEGLGNLSVMRANMGFMQMVSFMITPYEKNVPLCTLDFMYIFGNRKSYVEFYDLVGDTETDEYKTVLSQLGGLKELFADLDELPASENWYDGLLSVVLHKQLKDDTRNSELFGTALGMYLNAADNLSESSAEDKAAQLANTKAYSDGLIEKGGVSTDVFKKALGEDKTRDFFDRVFFGSANYSVS